MQNTIMLIVVPLFIAFSDADVSKLQHLNLFLMMPEFHAIFCISCVK